MRWLSVFTAALLAAWIISGIARADDAAEELQGLWVSRTPFERPTGELVVRRADGVWIATLGQRQGEVTVKGNDLLVRFPDGQGTFVATSGRAYAGQWTRGCFRQDKRWATIQRTPESCGIGSQGELPTTRRHVCTLSRRS